MKRVNIHLTEQQIKMLNDRAKISGLTVAELVRRAIDWFLRRPVR